MAHMLLQGMKAGELLVSVSDCALGFAIVQMCSLGSGWKLCGWFWRFFLFIPQPASGDRQVST